MASSRHFNVKGFNLNQSQCQHIRNKSELNILNRQQTPQPVSFRELGASFQFTVASYNVLAQCYVDEMADQLYRHCPHQYLEWNYRRHKILRQLENRQPDIICLQEVQEDHYMNFFHPQLQKLGYESRYKKRTRDKEDGCATFYKACKFVCTNSVRVEYRVPGSDLLDRDNIALLLSLNVRTLNSSRGGKNVRADCGHGQRICVANTHLLYNPRRGDVKLAQLMFLLAAIDEVAARTLEPNPFYDPVILCGDFNLEPGSDIFQLISDGVLDYQGLLIPTMSGQVEAGSGKALKARFIPREIDITDQCQFFDLTEHRYIQSRSHGGSRQGDRSFGSGIATHCFRFHSAYSFDENCITAWQTRPVRGVVVDYIFYSTCCRRGQCCDPNNNERLKLVGVRQLPNERRVRDAGGLPNEREPSDHLMLLATFALELR